jgi:hypothetical protein
LEALPEVPLLGMDGPLAQAAIELTRDVQPLEAPPTPSQPQTSDATWNAGGGNDNPSEGAAGTFEFAPDEPDTAVVDETEATLSPALAPPQAVEQKTSGRSAFPAGLLLGALGLVALVVAVTRGDTETAPASAEVVTIPEKVQAPEILEEEPPTGSSSQDAPALPEDAGENQPEVPLQASGRPGAAEETKPSTPPRKSPEPAIAPAVVALPDPEVAAVEPTIEQAPEPELASVRVIGKPQEVRIFCSGERFAPGPVPAGDCRFEAKFEGYGHWARLDLSLAPGQEVVVNCNPSFGVCNVGK